MARTDSRKARRYRNNYLAIVAICALAGCVTINQSGELTDEELKLSQYAALTSADAVNNLEKNYRSSTKLEIDVFAPKHYNTAGQALNEAKNLIAQNGPREQIVHKVAVGEAMLRNANIVTRKVKENLSNELELKNKLEALNTADAYGTEYGSLLDRLNKIIQSIETGKPSGSENREKLIKDMQLLEQKARRHNAMHEPEEILKRVKYRGGETLAPLTYKEAVEVFAQANEFIQENPTYEVGIEQIGKEALFTAKRALYITEQVAALSQKFSLSPEQIILDEEYRLHRVARELTHQDHRDHPLEVQSEILAKTAVEHANELKNKEALVTSLRDTLIEVRDSSSRLTSLSETATRLKAEKSEWLAKEALYKAKVNELQEKLQATITQLDQTQQTVLAIQNNNSTPLQTQLQATDTPNQHAAIEEQNILTQQDTEHNDSTSSDNDSEPSTTVKLPVDDKTVTASNDSIETPSSQPVTGSNEAQVNTSAINEIENFIQEIDSLQSKPPSTTGKKSMAEAEPTKPAIIDPVKVPQAANLNTDKDRIDVAEKAVSPKPVNTSSEQQTTDSKANTVATEASNKAIKEESATAPQPGNELVKEFQEKYDTAKENKAEMQNTPNPVNTEIFVDASE